jgi:hypothetical protein
MGLAPSARYIYTDRGKAMVRFDDGSVVVGRTRVLRRISKSS